MPPYAGEEWEINARYHGKSRAGTFTYTYRANRIQVLAKMGPLGGGLEATRRNEPLGINIGRIAPPR